ALFGMPRDNRRPARRPTRQETGDRKHREVAFVLALPMALSAAREKQRPDFRFEQLVAALVAPQRQRARQEQHAGQQHAFLIRSHIERLRPRLYPSTITHSNNSGKWCRFVGQAFQPDRAAADSRLSPRERGGGVTAGVPALAGRASLGFAPARSL